MNQKAVSIDQQPNRTAFENDLIQELHSFFRGWGVRWSKNADLSSLLWDYFTLLQKLIEPRARTVALSKRLETNLDSHRKRREIVYLRHLIERGGNVNTFLSKKALQTNFHDHLCNEWNIYHFHLSLQLDRKTGFVKQVNDLLFVHIGDDRAIFLDTDKHREGIFGDVKWQEILLDDFPEVMKPLESHWSDINPNPSAKGRQEYWDKGYTLGGTKVRGKVYSSPGIGRSTSGHGAMVGKNANTVLRWLWHITEQFESSYDLICEKLAVEPGKAQFNLQFGETTLEVVEKTTNTRVLTYREVVDI